MSDFSVGDMVNVKGYTEDFIVHSKVSDAFGNPLVECRNKGGAYIYWFRPADISHAPHKMAFFINEDCKYEDVIDYLHNLGYKWCSGKELHEFTPKVEVVEVIYLGATIDYDGKPTVTHSSMDWHEFSGEERDVYTVKSTKTYTVSKVERPSKEEIASKERREKIAELEKTLAELKALEGK